MADSSHFLATQTCSVNKSRGSLSRELNDALDLDLRKQLLKIFPRGCVALDLETTGLSPLFNKAVEFSAVKLQQNGQIEFFDYLVNPQVPIPKQTTAIHGINNDMLVNCPTIETLLPLFCRFADNLPIVGHNAKFDFGLLIYQFHLFNIPFPSFLVYCSLKASRIAFQEMSNYKLSTLTKHLGIPLKQCHQGLHDAFASLIIFAKAFQKSSYVLKASYLFSGQDFNRDTSFYLPNEMKSLAEKISTQEIVDLKYQRGHYKNIFRPIRPIGIFPTPQRSVLYAQCLHSGDFKNFVLSRIQEIKTLTLSEREKRQQVFEQLQDQKKSHVL